MVSWDQFWTPHSCQEKLALRMCNEQLVWVAAAVGLGERQIVPLPTSLPPLEPLTQGLGFQEGYRWAVYICSIYSLILASGRPTLHSL